MFCAIPKAVVLQALKHTYNFKPVSSKSISWIVSNEIDVWVLTLKV